MATTNPFKPTQVIEKSTKQTQAMNVQHVASKSRWQELLIQATASGAIAATDHLSNSQALITKGQDLARTGMIDQAVREENDKRLGSIWTAPAIKKGIQAIRTENSALSFSDGIRKLRDVPAGEGGFSGLSSTEAATKLQTMIAEQSFDDPQMQTLFNQQAQAMSSSFLEGHQERYLTKLANDQVTAATDHMYNLGDSLSSHYNDIRENNPDMSSDELDTLYAQQREAYATKFDDTMKILPTEAQRNQFITGSINNLMTSPETYQLGKDMYDDVLASPDRNLSAVQHETIRKTQARYEQQLKQDFTFESAQTSVMYEQASQDYRTPKETFLNNLRADTAKYGWSTDKVARYMKQYSDTLVRAGSANDVLNQAMTSGNAGDAYSTLDKRGKAIYQDSFNNMIHSQVAEVARKRNIKANSPEYNAMVTGAKLTALAINPQIEDTSVKHSLNQHMNILRSGVTSDESTRMLTSLYDMSKDAPHLLNNLSEDDQALLLDIGDRLQVSPESVQEIIANKARMERAVIPKDVLKGWETQVTELAFDTRRNMTDTIWGWIPFNAYTSDGREASQQMDATHTMAMDNLRLGKTDNVKVAWKMAEAKFTKGSTEIMGVRVPTGNKSMAARLQIDGTYPAEVVIATAVDQIVKDLNIPDGNIDIDYNMSAGVNGVMTIFNANTGEHAISISLEDVQSYIPAGTIESSLQEMKEARDSALQRMLLERDNTRMHQTDPAAYFSGDPTYKGRAVAGGRSGPSTL